MKIVELLLLAMALCVDSLVVSTTCSFKSKMTVRRGILMAVIFAFFQALFPLLGAVLGLAFKDLISAVDHWIAFGLLLLVGGKMIVDALWSKPDDKPLDLSKTGVLCLLGIATSIDAFVVGIGLGLDNSFIEILIAVLVIGVVTFLFSMLGYVLGNRNIPIPEKGASIVAGLVLIGLGLYTLAEHLMLF